MESLKIWGGHGPLAPLLLPPISHSIVPNNIRRSRLLWTNLEHTYVIMSKTFIVITPFVELNLIGWITGLLSFKFVMNSL